MRIFSGLLAAMVIVLFSCQQEPVELPDPLPEVPGVPEINNLPKKIVEVDDRDHDSIVTVFSWSATGELQQLTRHYYESGTIAFTEMQVCTYTSDKLLSHIVYRGKDLVSGDPYRGDQHFFHNAGKIVGIRITDSGHAEVDYWKYLYDSKGRISRELQEMDSVEYFESNPAVFPWYDSLVYNSSDQLTEVHSMSANWATMSFHTSYFKKFKNLDTRQNYFPAGINSYMIFEEDDMLTGSNPGLVEYEYPDAPVAPVTGNIAWTTTYDSHNRPVKMTYVHNSPGGAGGFPVFVNVTGSRTIYY